ncbi:MAG TPA: L,D-transpeptidase family protein [Thermoanaerobaculia bacterium]|nr:L,D-transpeptidase family protein [Thermoanaerobaculia bacterium]
MTVLGRSVATPEVRGRLLAALTLLSLAALAECLGCHEAVGPPAPEPAARVLRASLERAALPPAVRLHGERKKAWKAMQDFYARRGYQPAWWDRGSLRRAARRLPDAVDRLAADGLDTRLYPGQELRRLTDAVSSADRSADHPEAVAALDAGLTYTFLTAAAHLAIGRIQPPERVRVGEHAAPPAVDLAAALERALGPDEDPAGVLAGLAPRAAGYARLRQALARYRDLAARGAPVADAVRHIELNLERWRWTGDPGSRYLLVNIPDFRLAVIEGGKEVLTMKVIVGKAHRPTPAFSDVMTELVLNPSWHIPDSIAAGEIVPELLRDPAYLRRKGYEIKRRDGAGGPAAASDIGGDEIRQLGKSGSPYRLVQPPGADNALGRYKFVFPNHFDVYLHDTPGNGSLFARSERDFSHGCIRLEQPAALAAYVLAGDPQWPPPAVEAALATGRTVTIRLRRPLPVHILYQTAWVDPDGTLELRPDVYGHDSWLAAALAAETPLWDDLRAIIRPAGPGVRLAARMSHAATLVR